MKDQILSRARRITDARSAAAFADPLRRRLVLQLVKQEQSLVDLATLMQLDIRRLHYHVVALTKLGLVAVARERSRAGRPIKLYRATAQAFFVPDGLASAHPTDALHSELQKAVARQRQRDGSGVIYCLSEDGSPRMRPVRTSTGQQIRAGELGRIVRLSHSDARRLSEEIAATISAYAERSEGKNSYLVYFGFARR